MGNKLEWHEIITIQVELGKKLVELEKDSAPYKHYANIIEKLRKQYQETLA